MKRILLLFFIYGLLIPYCLFAAGNEEGEFTIDDPRVEIKAGPLIDMDVLPDTGFVTYRTDEAEGLDEYINNSIEFDILMNENVDAVSDSYLILSVYDVDVKAEKPEIDKVYLNDNYVGKLSGDNNAWSFSTFSLKKKWLNGKKDGRPGVNRVRIDVDTREYSNFWVLCDWGAIKANIGFQVISVEPYSVSYENKHEIKIIFNEELDEYSLEGNIKLTYIDLNEIKFVHSKVEYYDESNLVLFTPLEDLVYGIEYTVIIETGVKNKKGVNLRYGKSSSFVPLPQIDEKRRN
jgi:hypothetical protein